MGVHSDPTSSGFYPVGTLRHRPSNCEANGRSVRPVFVSTDDFVNDTGDAEAVRDEKSCMGDDEEGRAPNILKSPVKPSKEEVEEKGDMRVCACMYSWGPPWDRPKPGLPGFLFQALLLDAKLLFQLFFSTRGSF